MKLIRTPDEHYFDGGSVKFSTSRKDGELYFKVVLWDKNKSHPITFNTEKVEDEAHLKELQCMEKEIET